MIAGLGALAIVGAALAVAVTFRLWAEADHGRGDLLWQSRGASYVVEVSRSGSNEVPGDMGCYWISVWVAHGKAWRLAYGALPRTGATVPLWFKQKAFLFATAHAPTGPLP